MTHHDVTRSTVPETNAPTKEKTDDGRGAAESSPGDAPAPVLSYSGELLRKGLHLLALVIPAGMLVLGRSWSILILLPVAGVALGADVLRARSGGFARFIDGLFGRMMRPSERPPPGSPAVINGATWVLISAALVTVLFPVDLAAPAFAAFMVADAAAAVTGIRFGSRRWAGTSRTVEGSIAFAVVAMLCLLPFDHLSIGGAAAAALGGAAAEIPEWRVNDNVRVPLIMTAILYLWGI